MKRFCIKILKITILVYSILYALQFLIDYSLAKENICNNNIWYKIFNNKLETDIVVLGNSRAEAHYDPAIISSETKLKTYNLGLSGSPINILLIRWNSYLNRNTKPKIIILDLDNILIGTSNKLYQKFQYLPYYNKPEFRNIAKEFDKEYYFEKFIPIYKYRGYEMDIYNQVKSLYDDSNCEGSVNGYTEFDLEWIEKDWIAFEKKMNTSLENPNDNFNKYENGIKLLNGFLYRCKQNDIKVFLIWSPFYHESHSYKFREKNYLDSIFKNISKNYEYKYLNFSKDSIAFNKRYFYNHAHLNKKGATIFSKKIGQLIIKNDSHIN